MTIPKKYQFAFYFDAPKHMVEAWRHYGTLEHKGKGDNVNIKAWAKEIGGNVAKVYTADEVPWCGLFVAIVIHRTRKGEVVKDPLWALNWGNFGEFTKTPEYGDVLVFVRTTATGAKAGHVGFYIGEDDTHFHVFGGNQQDATNVSRIPKSRLYQARKVVYKIGKPKVVKRYYLPASGEVLTKAA